VPSFGNLYHKGKGVSSSSLIYILLFFSLIPLNKVSFLDIGIA
jgi:hypothetical protein